VRSNDSGALGFLTDLRRLNVAITRPKHFLLIVGNAQTLCSNEVWSNLIQHCKAKGCFVEVNDPHNAKNNLKNLGEFEEQARGSKRQKL
jgi:superfamily I DNA and/or RNA helicase